MLKNLENHKVNQKSEEVIEENSIPPLLMLSSSPNENDKIKSSQSQKSSNQDSEPNQIVQKVPHSLLNLASVSDSSNKLINMNEKGEMIVPKKSEDKS